MLSLFYSHRKLQYELGKKKEIFFYEFDQYAYRENLTLNFAHFLLQWRLFFSLIIIFSFNRVSGFIDL